MFPRRGAVTLVCTVLVASCGPKLGEPASWGDVRLSRRAVLKAKGMRYPKSVRISPDGMRAFVQNLQSGEIAGNTMVYDTRTLALVETIQHPGGRPVETAFTRHGNLVWVSYLAQVGPGFPPYFTEGTPEGDQYDVPSVVAVWDRTQGTLVSKVPVGVRPKVVAPSPDESVVLVSNYQSGTVSAIRSSDYRVLATLTVGRRPRGIAFTPDGTRAFVAIMGENALAEIDVNHLKVDRHIRGVGRQPRHLVPTPDGRSMYISFNGEGTVARFDMTTRAVVSRASVGSQPRTEVLSADGRRLFVVAYKDALVSVLDTRSMKVAGRARTGKLPVGCDVTPDGRQLWVTNYTSHSTWVYDVPDHSR
jgi:YVTN family beta-propeller protein